LSVIDRLAVVALPMALLLAQGAVVTSVGLALATWIRRVGRAVAISVASYAAVAFGWIILLESGAVSGLLAAVGLLDPRSQDAGSFVYLLLVSLCPLGPQLIPFNTIGETAERRGADYLMLVLALLATLGFALIVLALALTTFDRCVGRLPDRPRRVPRPPRRAATAPAPHGSTPRPSAAKAS
jgi:hypothetical protein